MPKLDKAYQTYFDYVRREIWFVDSLYQFVAKKDSTTVTADEYYKLHNMSPITGLKTLLLSPLQHFMDIGKNLIDTIRPYKSLYHVRQDFMQPLSGLGNILKGLFYIIAAPLTLIVNTLIVEPFKAGQAAYYGYPGTKVLEIISRNTGIHFLRTASWMFDGVLSILRGITQIATTPLTWFIKMPLRGIITAVSGIPNIEESRVIQQLVAEGAKVLDENEPMSGYSVDMITNALHGKFQKAYARGESTKIDPTEELNKLGARYFHVESGSILFYTETFGKNIVKSAKMDEEHIIHARRYLGLFSITQSMQPEEQQPDSNEEKTPLMTNQ